jgi:outer membrane protein assembly factor BamD
MAVGRFYLEREQYTAAIRRFNIVIKAYDTTNQVPEAIYRTAEAYYALGLSDQSERLYQVAQYNYPESVWTERLASLRAAPEQPPEKGMFERSIDVITDIFN